MKFAYLGAFSETWNTECMISRSLRRAGHEVLEIEEAGSRVEQIVDLCRQWTPDVFLFAKGRVSGQWDATCWPLEKVVTGLRGLFPEIAVACWVFDLLAKDFAEDRWQWAHNVSKLADLFFMTDGDTAKYLPNAVVLRQGIPDDACDGTPKDGYRCDVLFLGYPYRERREWANDLMTAYGDRFRIIPDGCHGLELCDAIASAKVVIGPSFPAYKDYWSNRIYVVTGCGGCFIAPNVQGMFEEGWRAQEHYAAYDGRAMMLNTINWLLREDEVRERIRKAGTTFARSRCTYDIRVRELVGRIQAMKEARS